MAVDTPTKKLALVLVQQPKERLDRLRARFDRLALNVVGTVASVSDDV